MEMYYYYTHYREPIIFCTSMGAQPWADERNRFSIVVLPFNPGDTDYFFGSAARAECDRRWGNGSNGVWGDEPDWRAYIADGMRA